MATSPSSARPSQSGTSTPSTQAPLKKPSVPPVTILLSQTAQVYAVAHPLFLLALYAVRFPTLVADPVGELVTEVPVLAVSQLAYAMICLPAAGSTNPPANVNSEPTTPSSRAGKPGLRRRHHHHKSESRGLGAKIIPAFLSLALSFLLATPVLAILLVLFGAPLTTHNLHTLACAAHMALLAAAPLIYVHGVDGSVWKQVWGLARPADAVWGGAVGTGLGAWLGAVPIPLDWDRPWQAFPITILTGAYIGFALGSLVCRTTWLYGRRIQFNAEEDDGEEKKLD